jgi:hypothetical protein
MPLKMEMKGRTVQASNISLGTKGLKLSVPRKAVQGYPFGVSEGNENGMDRDYEMDRSVGSRKSRLEINRCCPALPCHAPSAQLTRKFRTGYTYSA